MNLLTKIVLIFILVGGVTIAFLLNSSDKEGREEYADFFYHKELNGTITFITSGTMGTVRMKLNNIDIEYTILPYRLDSPDFMDLAQAGDRFIKHAGVDTVQLISNGKVYKFTINRPG